MIGFRVQISGDEKEIELILCDCSDAQDDMYGVAMELEDCAFPWLSAISTTNDFCKACKTADVIIILPPTEKTAARHGNKAVDISYSTLSQIDFKSLDIAMHPTSISQMEAATVHCRGPLSTAFAIANCVGKLHEDAMKAIQYEQRLRHEEAEFGCPPDRSVENLMLNHCDYHFGPFRIESKTQIVFVTSHDVEERSIDDIDLQSSDTYKRVFARL